MPPFASASATESTSVNGAETTESTTNPANAASKPFDTKTNQSAGANTGDAVPFAAVTMLFLAVPAVLISRRKKAVDNNAKQA